MKHAYLDAGWQFLHKRFRVINYIFPLCLFACLHKRTDHICLMSFLHLIRNKRICFRPVCRINHTVFDRKPSCRHLIHNRNIHISVDNDRKGSWNRCCTHNKNMRHIPFLCKLLSLPHAKTMLLICDHKRKICICRFFLNQRMRSYNQGILIQF